MAIPVSLAVTMKKSCTGEHVSEKNRGLVYDMLARGPGVRENG